MRVAFCQDVIMYGYMKHVTLLQTTHLHIPEDSHLRDNFKSQEGI